MKTFENMIGKEWLKDLDKFFESPKEWLEDHNEDYNEDIETYTVTITGLGYVDAHNIVDMGLEYGETVSIEQEGDEQ